MKINLKQLFSIVGETRDFAYEIGTDELSDIRGYSFASPVEVKGRLYNRAGVVYLEYSVDLTLHEGESIEMNEAAVTDLLLRLPTKNLCKEDCKGLCMVCGCDLNESTCEHINTEP